MAYEAHWKLPGNDKIFSSHANHQTAARAMDYATVVKDMTFYGVAPSDVWVEDESGFRIAINPN